MPLFAQTPLDPVGADPGNISPRTLEFGTQDSQAWELVADDKSLKESPC